MVIPLTATSIKNQLVIYDLLLETRIKIQKLLISANTLPQYDTYQQFFQLGGNVFERSRLEAKGKLEELKNALTQLLILSQSKFSSKGDESDEEIESETDNETEITAKLNKSKNEEISIATTQDENIHEELISKSKKVIDYWFSRTRYAMKDGKIDRKNIENEPSIINIIEEILSNRVRLIKKSQMKRSSYRTMGKPSIQNDNENSMYASNYELDKEIYDDEDFYRQLLRQLIESKMSSETIDPIALSRKWVQIQKLRSKMKRKIDTKASKGRKIRYQVYDKLVGFMAPFDNGTYVDKAKDALYKSLFGQ